MVTFVGIHYKEGMEALDSRTRSGKKIDDVISRLNCECKKDNVFDETSIPETTCFALLAFTRRVPDEGVIVVLGKQAQKHFPSNKYKKAIIINHRHPSFSPRSFAEDLAGKILEVV